MIRSKIAMGFLWALLGVLLHMWPGVIAPAHGQGSRKDDIVFNSRGIPLAGATVRVCAMPASGQPCSPLALIYSDAALTQALANPTTTDGLGNYSFYAAPGKYEIEISGPGITTKQLPNVILPNDPASPNFSAVSAFSLNLSGNLTVNGNTSVIGNLASGTLNLANQSTPPGAASFGTVNLYTKTADKLLYYKDETGTETGPLGPGAQTNVSNNWSAQQNFNANQRFKGPNPYVDITAFGARAGNPNTTPYAVGLTANCNSVTNPTQVTISSASTFQNGDGLVVYGCGAPHSMSTPAAPTVTPSLALAGTGTLLNTPGPTGSTTYNYKVVARDRNGGLTAASSTGTTTTGAASLGAIPVNITSMSRSGQTVTVTTASAHGFLVGCNTATCGEVFIGGGNGLSDATFRGWYSVASAPDTTHFTFVGPPTTTLGATTSATGGTATFYNCNLVSWPAVTGAVQYYIYSDRANPGTFALIGVSNPNSASGTQDLSWEDYGSPMEDNQAFPAFVPATAPSSASSDHLSTTIASGAGTTTLTLANAAGTTVTGATIRLDAAPGIAAAAASITNGYGTLYIPTDANGNTFVVNSWLQLNGSAYAVAEAGALYLNDTVEVTAVGNGGAQWIGNVMPQRGAGPSVTSWSSGPTVSINSAHPGWFLSGSQQGLHMSHVSINSVPTNGTQAVLVESGFNQTFDWVDCSPGTGLGDYMSSCFQFRAVSGQANSNVTLDYVGMSPGGGGDGVSHTPTAYFRGSGNVIVPHAYSVHRGMLYSGNAGIQLGVGGVVYINGGGTPLLTTYSSFGSAVIGTVVLDTIAHPCVAGLINGSGLVGVQFVNGSCIPSSGVLPVSGNYGSLTASGSLSSFNTFSNAKGLVTSNLGSNNFVAQDYKNSFDIVGPNYASFINNAPMAAPTCSVSAGGSLTVGQGYVFFIVPIWQNSQDGQPSLGSTTCTPTSGNQTITINWTAAPGNPKGYDLYYCGAPCGPVINQGAAAGASNAFANPQPPSATSLVWTSNSFTTAVASGISRGGPTMLMPGTQGIATPALTFAGSTINPPASGFTATRNIGFPDNSGIIPVSSYQNSAYDNATRANGAIGSNWTVANNGINISSNNFVGTVTSANDVAFWAVNAFSPAQFSQATLTALNGTTDFPGTAVLLSGSGAATHGYNCVEDTTNIFIQKITGTSNSTLTSAATTGVAGDILRLEVDSAGNLTCYKNGVSTLTVSDTTYTSGSPGLFLFGAVATAKNWSGGNLHPLSHLDSEQDWTKTQHFTQGIALGAAASESFNNSPRSEQNVFLPGALTSTWTGSTWTTDKPVTITRVQVQAKTAPSGCTTNAVVRLTDGTTPVNVTISAASNDSGAFAQSYAAGSSLTIAVQTAAAGCTTSPADANVTVQYRMQ